MIVIVQWLSSASLTENGKAESQTRGSWSEKRKCYLCAMPLLHFPGIYTLKCNCRGTVA